jgi:hypothetical protein
MRRELIYHTPEIASDAAVGRNRHREILRLCTPGQTMVQTPGSAFWGQVVSKGLTGLSAANRWFNGQAMVQVTFFLANTQLWI